MDAQIRANVRFNIVTNVMDGAFFGAALGLASFVTVIPLFVKSLTDSALLIGLIAAIHSVGWQLPQLFTVSRVARLRRFKPMVLLMTIQERVPFGLLALVAWQRELLGRELALGLTFVLLIWQGLGGGFTATAWQSMIGKIMPPQRRGTFYGLQSAAANLLASGGAILAGLLLERLPAPLDYVACFGLAAVAMTISWGFLAQTREPAHAPPPPPSGPLRAQLGAILRRDRNFRWFLAARLLAQLAMMGLAFYTVYAVERFGIGEQTAGLLTALLMIAQTAANPLMGWAGDRWGHRVVMELGALAAVGSALLIWLAPTALWLYPAFALAGVAGVSFWTTALAITLEFGSEAERPAYIGLANTLVAPGTLLAPLLGGWLAELAGYQASFAASVVGGMATVLVLRLLVRDPRQLTVATPTIAPAS